MSVILLNQENFETEVLNSSIPVFVDFFSEWCGPCRMMEPIVKEIAEQHGGNVWVESGELKGSTFYFSISKNF